MEIDSESETTLTAPVVFVLEDDEDLRNILQMLIESYGYEVRAAGSRSQFLEIYQADQPGCLLMDLYTPSCQATELYEDLKNGGGFHPFVIVSGQGSVPSAAQAMRTGAVDFLTKPVDHKLLRLRIDEAVELDQQRRSTMRQRQAVESGLNMLSKRESQILDFLVQGIPSKQIGKRLDIGTSTVDVHRSNIMKKMAVKSSVELASMIARHSADTLAR